MDPRRRFTATERVALFAALDGCCAECGTELAPGWHSDHVNPHSRGGPTDLVNGQALCPPCNLTKGAHVPHYVDSFEPRPFQTEVIEAVRNNHASGTKVTVVLAAPGSGKTITSQAVACEMLRDGAIDHLVTLVPRITLARQAEIDWRAARVNEPRSSVPEDWTGDFELFDPSCRIESIEHTRNRVPLLSPGPRGRGLVSTYSSLVSSHGQTAFDSFARQYAGRFLLVADEAQFCGDETDTGGGTRAGEMMKLLHHHAAHTLLMTGTPYRADGSPLILAEYGAMNDQGLRPLLTHVSSTYQDGVREGYLRKFEATLVDAKVRRREIATGVVTEYDLSRDATDLRQVVRRADVWQPIADAVVRAVRDKQHRHPDHRGLISCMDQGEARDVHTYLRRTYPGLQVSIATSDDTDAIAVLDAFKEKPADILVTVRMAFIGYDCKAITVVGVLTNYRDPGHLMQLVGRGLRAWRETPFDAQSCRIVAPDDPKMQDFVKVLRQELEQGLRERAQREADAATEGEDGSPSEDAPTTIVESAVATATRAVSNDVDLDADQLRRINDVAHRFGITEDPTRLFEFVREMEAARRTPDEPAHEPPAKAEPVVQKTTDERITDLGSETAALIRETLTLDGVRGGDPGYGDAVMELTKQVNKAAGANARVAKANEQAARRRRDVARQLRDNALGRGQVA